MQKIPLYALLATLLLSAGCFEPITSVNLATPLGSFGNNIAQRQGFGELPNTPQITESNAVVRINTDLPSLQPDVTVVRLPPNGLNDTQFQNLTTSIGMPIGLIGQQANNLEIAFTWTNTNNEVWSYDSNLRRLTYANASNSPNSNLADTWPTDTEISDAIDNFMINRGMNPLSYRNPTIQKDWKEWKRQIDENETCINQTTINTYGHIINAKSLLRVPPPPDAATLCISPQFPSRIPITFDLVIDERNIINSNGQSEIGGFLILNTNTLDVEYAWITLSATPVRSDYPAISADEMRQNMINGGLGGSTSGSIDINETFFAFVRLDTGDEYSYKYLVPALIGSGTKTLSGTKTPYNIVVPLTK
jgi:hypothetical protein